MAYKSFNSAWIHGLTYEIPWKSSVLLHISERNIK